MNNIGATSLPIELVDGVIAVVSAFIGWLMHKWFGK